MNDETVQAVALAVTLLALLGIAWVLTRAILSASNSPGNIALIVSLSLLTGLALVLIPVVQADAVAVVAGLAGVGLGALAGAVQQAWGGRDDDPDRSTGRSEPDDHP